MSDLTPCNKCAYERSKKYYEDRGQDVRLEGSKNIPGWTALVVDNEETAWYLEMPKKCEC